jgi:hypothetical protein
MATGERLSASSHAGQYMAVRSGSQQGLDHSAGHRFSSVQDRA